MSDAKHNLEDVCSHFELQADFVSAEAYGSGHINDTYAVTCSRAGKRLRYILQRINHQIFKDVPALMRNIERVTDALHTQLETEGSSDRERRALTLIPTTSGSSYYVDDAGCYWRVYVFIEDARTYDQIESTGQAFEAARAFGLFMKQLRELPGEPVVETIPDFHNTRSRFNAFEAAIEADAVGRVAEARDQIAFARERESMVDVLLGLQACGEVPVVTTHNDTKLNNVMIDDETGKGICVIDLDTVMPGQALYDFGDMVRTAARPTLEDEQDLSKVVACPEMIEAVTRGYMTAAGDVLNAAEKEHLLFSARLITFEIGLRFLTDYLEGDVYFKTHRPGQNLDRSRVQFKMVASFEEQQDALERMVAGIVKDCAGM